MVRLCYCLSYTALLLSLALESVALVVTVRVCRWPKRLSDQLDYLATFLGVTPTYCCFIFPVRSQCLNRIAGYGIELADQLAASTRYGAGLPFANRRRGGGRIVAGAEALATRGSLL